MSSFRAPSDRHSDWRSRAALCRDREHRRRWGITRGRCALGRTRFRHPGHRRNRRHWPGGRGRQPTLPLHGARPLLHSGGDIVVASVHVDSGLRWPGSSERRLGRRDLGFCRASWTARSGGASGTSGRLPAPRWSHGTTGAQGLPGPPGVVGPTGQAGEPVLNLVDSLGHGIAPVVDANADGDGLDRWARVALNVGGYVALVDVSRRPLARDGYDWCVLLD